MESTQGSGMGKRETCFVPQISAAEENARKFAECLSRMADDIEKAIPLARRLFYDFAHLRKGQTIMSCRTQEEWAQKYAHRTARALRYMFEGGTAEAQRTKRLETERKIKTEMISVLPPAQPSDIAKPAEPMDVIPPENPVALEIRDTYGRMGADSLRNPAPRPKATGCMACNQKDIEIHRLTLRVRELENALGNVDLG